MTIEYPYLPAGRTIEYVSADNPFMKRAADVCRAFSTDLNHPTGSVIVANGLIIGAAANQAAIRRSFLSNIHRKFCSRRLLGIKTGKHYWLCPGCASPKNHSEPKAIAAARAANEDLSGADLYLWGHWWLCEPCWNAIIAARIQSVYLLEGSETLFDRAKPGNIVGKQCA